MKKLIIIFMILSTLLFAQAKNNILNVYVKVNENSIHLKWMTKNYKSSNIYKLYKTDNKSKEKLIATINAVSYKDLQNSGYKEDYIFMIYPFKNAKTLKDKIQLRKIEDGIAVFRSLSIAQDNQFAKNIGQYYIDKNIDKNIKYTYKLVLIEDAKEIAKTIISVDKNSIKDKSDIFWIQAKDSTDGVKLSWDTSKKHSFYHIYRKLENERKFCRLTKTPLYIDSSKSEKDFIYMDSNLKKGQKATYFVRKIDIFGAEKKPTRHVKAQRVIILKPKPVTNIFVKNSSSKISLRWKKVVNTLGYNIYRSENSNGGFKKLNKKLIKKEVFFDENFKENQNYYYYITSVNMYDESNPSTKMLAFVRDITPPSFPKNLKATVSKGKVLLKWKKQNEKDLLGYKLYVSMDKENSEWALVTKNAIKENIYLHVRPKELSRNFYYYRVSAIDKTFNESALSNIVKVKLPDVTPPPEPVLTRFNAYSSKIILSWEKVLVYDFSHYNVYKKKDKQFIKLNNKPIFKTNYIDKNPSSINEYVITAVDKSNNESKKIKTAIIKKHDIISPKVSGESIKIYKNNIKLSFVCKDKDFNGFDLLRSSGNTNKYINISGFKKKKSYIDKTTIKGKTYFYIFKVYDKSGNITQSKTLQITNKI